MTSRPMPASRATPTGRETVLVALGQAAVMLFGGLLALLIAQLFGKTRGDRCVLRRLRALRPGDYLHTELPAHGRVAAGRERRRGDSHAHARRGGRSGPGARGSRWSGSRRGSANSSSTPTRPASRGLAADPLDRACRAAPRGDAGHVSLRSRCLQGDRGDHSPRRPDQSRDVCDHRAGARHRKSACRPGGRWHLANRGAPDSSRSGWAGPGARGHSATVAEAGRLAFASLFFLAPRWYM